MARTRQATPVENAAFQLAHELHVMAIAACEAKEPDQVFDLIKEERRIRSMVYTLQRRLGITP